MDKRKKKALIVVAALIVAATLTIKSSRQDETTRVPPVACLADWHPEDPDTYLLRAFACHADTRVRFVLGPTSDGPGLAFTQWELAADGKRAYARANRYDARRRAFVYDYDAVMNQPACALDADLLLAALRHRRNAVSSDAEETAELSSWLAKHPCPGYEPLPFALN